MIDEKIEQIKEDFKKSQKILLALGDETRQSIFMALMESTCSTGMRVGEITKRTHLSRPAVSHHLKILRDANLISMRKEGTMNFYYIDIDSRVGGLTDLVGHINEVIDSNKKQK